MSSIQLRSFGARVWFCLYLQLLAVTALGQGDLQVYPKRILFDGTVRSREVNLVNNGRDTARYSISVIQIRMREDGTFETISKPDSGQYFADRNFRFFPRNVVLGPGESQTIKVQLVDHSSLAEGEYRSHLYLRAEQDRSIVKQDSAVGGLAIRMTPIYGISLPVLIRKGSPLLDVGISGVSFHLVKDSIPVIQLSIDRSGNISSYGDVSINHISAEGKTTRVADVSGIAVYTPMVTRIIRLELKRITEYHSGSLQVVYRDRSGKSEKLIQTEIPL